MAKSFFWFLVAVILGMVAVGLCGCRARRVTEQVVTERSVSVQSDSLWRMMARWYAATERERVSDRSDRSVWHWESATVNEAGDTLRHEVKDKEATVYVHLEESERAVLLARIDSLERVKAQRDTVYIDKEVKVTTLVERELSVWERFRLRTWAWLAIALAVLAGYTWRWQLLRMFQRILTKV